MASSSNLEITAASSSSSSSSSLPITWDVFLSFHGEETRKNFTSHLYSALYQDGIVTFIDDRGLEKGQEISSGLSNAIRDSKMFVVVISENYARSPWCLDELVEILGCKKTENHVVPVFYYVDPSDVRYQKGSFGEALDYHKQRYSPDMINKWKSALAQIAGIVGYTLKKHANENESETIKNIVERITQQVPKKVLHIGEELFGIDSAVEEICQKLMMESNDVRAIGVCGMGGLGKTTTAKAFYNKYSNRFETSCFIEKVKQYSQGGSPLLPLLEQLLKALLTRKDYKVLEVESGITQLKRILSFKKALVVLDDLDQSTCSEFLVRHCNLFSAGSRIIITTRNVNLLNQLKLKLKLKKLEVDIYMLNKLGQVHSLELFSYHAFGNPTIPASITTSLRELSVSFVTYAGGVPLALKVLGSSLCATDESFWKDKLDKIRKFPENDIVEIIQQSYNELNDETVKSIFLDIAFFFVGMFEYEAVDIFKSCDYFPGVGIKILVDRCLLMIDENNKLQMHDLIQDVGRKLAKSTRLQKNSLEDLQNQEELHKIEVLVLDLTQSREKQINSQIFERLPKLRILEIINAHGTKGHFKNSFRELRCIYWNHCPWTRLPSSFQPQRLISICMPYSNFKILWDGAMPFTSLKMIDVEYSKNLKMTPNFGNSKRVERLYFRGCESLLKVHSSIRELTALLVLDLTECIHLKDHSYMYGDLKRSSEPIQQWANMVNLFVGHCCNLRRLPKQLGDMKCLKELDASHSAIKELPDSITHLKGLLELILDGCKKLRKLPEQIGNMKGLRTFSARLSAIEQLPDSFSGLINLEILDLSYCNNLRNLPNNMCKLKLLKVLDLGKSSKLEQLPNELENMKCLEELNASFTAIAEVPDSIAQLSRLRLLDLSFCVMLKYVPDSLWNLTSLTKLYLYKAEINLPATVKDTNLVTLTLMCNIRSWLPVILSFSSLKRLVLSDGGESLTSTKSFSLSKLYNLQYLALFNCTSFGSSFPELPLNITQLHIRNHATLVQLPDFSCLKQLKLLDIRIYVSLQSLPPLPPHLQSLTVFDCGSLQELSNMSMLNELSFMNFGRCSSLESVGLKKSCLQVKDAIKQFLPSYKAYEVPKIADWFSYESTGRTVAFDIPSLLADNLLGLALFVLFTPNSSFYETSDELIMKAAVTNKTNGITKHCMIPLHRTGDELCYVVQCISGDEISIRGGDKIEISFTRQLYNYDGEQEVPSEQVKMQMYGAYVIKKTQSIQDFPSILSNLIN